MDKQTNNNNKFSNMVYNTADQFQRLSDEFVEIARTIKPEDLDDETKQKIIKTTGIMRQLLESEKILIDKFIEEDNKKN